VIGRNDDGSGKEFCGMRADCRRITMGSIGGGQDQVKKNKDEIKGRKKKN